MNIALVCSHGGHLTEMLQLMEAFEGNSIFFITYDSPRTLDLCYKKYLLRNIGTSFSKMAVAFYETVRILLKEKPDIIVSTGSEIAIPAFYIAKLFRIKTVFIESWCRVNIPSGTGKLVYSISDVFLVQWPQLLEAYGPKAKYIGAII
jgi:beta-1,4-N-acetylglucosaminyltransferase